MDTKKIKKGNVKMIAHRGLSGLELENTNLAFVAAGNRSYFGVETDIRCTADGDFILYHDDTTARLTDVDLPIEASDFSTLRSLPLHTPDGSFLPENVHMPTLEEYIGICKKYEKICVLELKNHMEEERVRTIVERIAALEYLENVTFISMDMDNLIYVRKCSPDQSIQLLYTRPKASVPYLIGEYDTALFDRLEKYGFDVDIHYKLLTKEAVDLFHQRGIRVNCWTVNNAEIAERFVEWGVDYITTNILE